MKASTPPWPMVSARRRWARRLALACDPLGRGGVEPQLAEQRHDRLGLVLLVGRGDAVTQRIVVMRRKVGEEGGRHGWASVVGQIAECGTAAASCKVPRQPSRNPILAVLSRSP